jgi:hypothetical protein
MSKQVTADVVHVDFLKFVEQVNKGSSVIDLSIALEQVVKAVKETGLSGELVYKLKIVPAGNTDTGDVSQVWAEDKIATKLPTRKRAKTLFFPTRDNTLSRMDPNQRDFIEEQRTAAAAEGGNQQ